MDENKRALEWATAFLENEEYSRDTYEDFCGTGDMDEDERKDLYEAMESSINLFKTIKVALEKQNSKKPKVLNYQPLLDAGWRYGCPECNCAVGENIHHSEVTNNEQFCCNCGQSLDWK